MKNRLLERISIDRNICHGKPHIRGTRIMVQQVLDLLSDGATPEEIITEDFPDLTLEDIRASIAFANQLLVNEEIHLYETKRMETV
ncbi:MAG: DUF433 domain-containing protein [candidate division KSB1 bacterium]|nr:DUF433 domain-containing protein [candidate division KSB1 bacterium]MDZ7303836.1 DUF433 domain-containing protein [candidate division KSB1 bacterium]MDZ7312737.1 DUF433 domain-containing protein [candidate division KSB1 bacterium]